MKQLTLCAILIAACGSASAAVVKFINTDPDFMLGAALYWEGGQPLDITQPVTNQPALHTDGPSWAVRTNYEEISSTYGDIQTLFGNSGARIATTVDIYFDGEGGLVFANVPKWWDVEEPLGPDAAWIRETLLWARHDDGRYDFTPATGTFFVGLEIALPDGVHYGFVEIQRLDISSWAPSFRPVSWGYETRVGVPLVIVPSPAAASLLVGAALIARRRR